VQLKEGSLFADPAEAAVPLGSLPWYETGITGLLVKGRKFEEVRIPLESPRENVTHFGVESELLPDGQVHSELEVRVKGSPAFQMRALLLDQGPDELEESLQRLVSMDLSDARVGKISHPDFHDTSQELVLSANVEHRLFDEYAGSQILLNPWVGDRMDSPVFKEATRSSAVKFPFLETTTSTSSWQFPPTVRVEEIPSEVKLETDFAEFSHSCSRENENKVICTRTYLLKELRLETMDDYQRAKEFFEEVVRHDQEVLLLYAN
jgi:hypothetical protein